MFHLQYCPICCTAHRALQGLILPPVDTHRWDGNCTLNWNVYKTISVTYAHSVSVHGIVCACMHVCLCSVCEAAVPLLTESSRLQVPIGCVVSLCTNTCNKTCIHACMHGSMLTHALHRTHVCVHMHTQTQ